MSRQITIELDEALLRHFEAEVEAGRQPSLEAALVDALHHRKKSSELDRLWAEGGPSGEADAEETLEDLERERTHES